MLVTLAGQRGIIRGHILVGLAVPRRNREEVVRFYFAYGIINGIRVGVRLKLMNKRLLRDLVEELKARYAALTRIWKPYKRIIFVLSIPTAVSAFVISTGSFTLIIVGFVALACVLAFAPPL